jgi:hypothetical protein
MKGLSCRGVAKSEVSKVLTLKVQSKKNVKSTDKRHMKWLFFTLILSTQGVANDSVKRLEAMVKSGAIPAEVARVQSKLLHNPKKTDMIERGEAQRGLASIEPALRPMPIKQFRAAPLVLFLD